MMYFDNVFSTLNDAIHTLDENEFNRLVKECCTAIKSGNKIIASGLGKNVPICDKFVGTMNSLGLNAAFLHTNSAVHGDMGIVKENDLVIILTKSGETIESVYLTDLLKKRSVNMWLLTFSRKSTLTEKIPNHLAMDLSHEGDMWNIMPNNSTTLNLIVLQALAMQMAQSLDLSLEDFKRNHPGGHIGEILKE